jgi:hypothetical protein
MPPEPFYEEDDEQLDEQSDEQSDKSSSGRGEPEYTTPCNVLANPQDYENNTAGGVQLIQFDYTRVDLTLRNRYINYVTHAKGAGMVMTTFVLMLNYYTYFKSLMPLSECMIRYKNGQESHTQSTRKCSSDPT